MKTLTTDIQDNGDMAEVFEPVAVGRRHCLYLVLSETRKDHLVLAGQDSTRSIGFKSRAAFSRGDRTTAGSVAHLFLEFTAAKFPANTSVLWWGSGGSFEALASTYRPYDWADSSYDSTQTAALSEGHRDRRVIEPCPPISTILDPGRFRSGARLQRPVLHE